MKPDAFLKIPSCTDLELFSMMNSAWRSFLLTQRSFLVVYDSGHSCFSYFTSVHGCIRTLVPHRGWQAPSYHLKLISSNPSITNQQRVQRRQNQLSCHFRPSTVRAKVLLPKERCHGICGSNGLTRFSRLPNRSNKCTVKMWHQDGRDEIEHQRLFFFCWRVT